MAVVGYCPLARGKVPADEVLRTHRPRPRQDRRRRWRCAFSSSRSIIPIPRTSKRERLAENLGSLEFTLSDAEMAEIGKLGAAGLAHRQPAAGAAMG